jgi:ATP-dependent Clp protease ATP-binding subunit ClpC
MTYFEIKKASRSYYPVIALERVFPRKVRSGVLMFFGIFGLVAGFISLPLILVDFKGFNFLEEYLVYSELAASIFFVALGVYMSVMALHAYVNSYYFRGFESTQREKEDKDTLKVSFETAVLSYFADERDMTLSFATMAYGRILLMRAGISPEAIGEFIQTRQTPLPSEKLVIEISSSDNKIRLPDIAKALYKADEEFAKFLFAKKVQERDFLSAAKWVSDDVIRSKKRSRYWGRDALGRITGLGKDWAYGGTYKLKRYATEMNLLYIPSIESRPLFIRNEVEKLEKAMIRAREANALLIGEDGGSKTDIILGLVNRIQEGSAYPQLEHKKVFELDTNRLVSETGSKARFESEFMDVLIESLKAGNIILYIPDLANFIQSVQTIGANVPSLIDQFLASKEIQFIAASSPGGFHKVVEPVTSIITKFEILNVKEVAEADSLESLEAEAERVEAQYGMVFSVPVLKTISESAERFITEGIMPDKAIDLLYDVASAMNRTGRKYLTVDDVQEIIKEKVGIPTGAVTSKEQGVLSNLEKFLHERVIGQNEAVNAIASAMKRARAGLTNPKRPMGSFLFLGPSGVGKTETTKALAETFFGSEDRILRLDMSEYKGPESLAKLIGSFEANTPGILSNMLKEKPYGVLLLDEFEKSSREVMDLFLQILDEGFFSDMYGQKVNARNLIIIATSNAGSDYIWDIVKKGEDLASKKDMVIDAIVKEGIYRPELLNRFDGVILFHPIDTAALKQIAALMLSKLKKRLASKGFELIINDALIDYLMKFGSDPKFGARPMNRAIQDKVEQAIADRIIRGDIKAGDKIEFQATDLV